MHQSCIPWKKQIILKFAQYLNHSLARFSSKKYTLFFFFYFLIPLLKRISFSGYSGWKKILEECEKEKLFSSGTKQMKMNANNPHVMNLKSKFDEASKVLHQSLLIYNFLDWTKFESRRGKWSFKCSNELINNQ